MNTPTDLITLTEARHLLGISDNKMTALVKSKALQTNTIPLDKRKKLVSRVEVLKLKEPRAEAA